MPLAPLPVRGNPWKSKKKEVKLNTPWIEVELHEVINPSGNPGIYGVTRFKNLAIGILPVDEDGNTYIVGQYRFPMDCYTWEIPEGGGPYGIDPLESAKRELKEETGIEAQRWDLIQTLQLSNSATNEEAYIFLARDLKYGESEPEENEDLEIRKISVAELYERVKSAEITDSLTVAAVLRYRIMELEGSLH
ncbi:MAG: NUDIX hydrolase [Bacteroidota bacterium]|nr:NUDIX hydrolase [Bacteroidota bacterium]MDX5430466.1 NUDIX hydrolase [Bacteroidota bacterium]MDX5469227.1 NUDIX hydrolase [Bacteroidota bacterium]